MIRRLAGWLLGGFLLLLSWGFFEQGCFLFVELVGRLSDICLEEFDTIPLF